MGKMTIYIGVMSGILLMFYLAGFVTESSSTLLTMLLHPFDMTNWNFTNTIMFSIESLIAIGISLLLLTSGKPDLIPMTAIAIFVFDLGLGFISVFNKINATYPEVALILFAPIMILFVMTLVEWWRGITT